ISIDHRNDGGYYTGGRKHFDNDDQQMWVQALNDTGGIIWEKIWGPQNSLASAHLTTTSDDHALIASGWGIGSGTALRHYLCKLDQYNGDIIWQKQYSLSSSS